MLFAVVPVVFSAEQVYPGLYVIVQQDNLRFIMWHVVLDKIGLFKLEKKCLNNK